MQGFWSTIGDIQFYSRSDKISSKILFALWIQLAVDRLYKLDKLLMYGCACKDRCDQHGGRVPSEIPPVNPFFLENPHVEGTLR